MLSNDSLLASHTGHAALASSAAAFVSGDAAVVLFSNGGGFVAACPPFDCGCRISVWPLDLTWPFCVFATNVAIGHNIITMSLTNNNRNYHIFGVMAVANQGPALGVRRLVGRPRTAVRNRAIRVHRHDLFCSNQWGYGVRLSLWANVVQNCMHSVPRTGKSTHTHRERHTRARFCIKVCLSEGLLCKITAVSDACARSGAHSWPSTAIGCECG